jgi:hypothetical protein
LFVGFGVIPEFLCHCFVFYRRLINADLSFHETLHPLAATVFGHDIRLVDSHGVWRNYRAVTLRVLDFVYSQFGVVAYDTQYAMVDRDDDLRIGVKSTAILFAQYDNKIITLLQLITLGLLCWLGNLNYFHVSYFLMLGVVTLFFIYQCRLIKHRKREDCFSAFLNNNYFGMMVFVAMLCGLFIL